MVSVNGYFDGNVVKPLEKIDAKPNQRVIITIMDEFFTPEPKKDIKSMRGVLAQYADP
jgi:predicted DNA-binding antitoxin AbrB/MazE fold protein